jgi:ribosome-associated protein
MVRINDQLTVPDEELTLTAIRAQGAGGQNVNKVASAIHLRFDIPSSSLPEAVKQRLLDSRDQRITADGVIVIKAQNHRTQEKNRAEALQRFCDMIAAALKVPKKRVPTRPSRAAKERRLQAKKMRSELKKFRTKGFD